VAKRSLSGDRHAHGCTRCRVRYEDACTTPDTDGLCTTCRGGRAWQALIDSAAPHPCCLEHSRLVTKDQKSTYKLAGAHLWFLCRECHRTHPFDPRRTP
jgi:hypothetical protein